MKRFQAAFMGILTAMLCAAAYAAGTLQPAADVPPQDEPEMPASAVMLFVENGLWGARTGGGRVLLEPEWYRLQMMQGNVLAAQKNDRSRCYGLITTDGEQLTPFFYHSMDEIMPDVWRGVLSGSEDKIHLYHKDGSRWAERAWDSCDASDGQLRLKDGNVQTVYLAEQNGLHMISYAAEYSVGLHKLSAAFSKEMLASLPEEQELTQIGEAAAAYLEYLFLSPDTPPDSSLFSNASNALGVAYLYRGSTYVSGEISRIFTEEKDDGFPSYQLLMPIRYAVNSEDGQRKQYSTAIRLTISRNSAGMYIYTDFEDVRFQMMNGD